MKGKRELIMSSIFVNVLIKFCKSTLNFFVIFFNLPTKKNKNQSKKIKIVFGKEKKML
jgi:hypothetical protein